MTNLVFSDSKPTAPKIKNMRSIPPCSKSFIWWGFKTPLTKNLRCVEYKSSIHISIKAPPATRYSSKYLSFPSKPGTGFQTLTLNDFGFDKYLTKELHICHTPTNKNNVPGKAWPLKEPILFVYECYSHSTLLIQLPHWNPLQLVCLLDSTNGFWFKMREKKEEF